MRKWASDKSLRPILLAWAEGLEPPWLVLETSTLPTELCPYIGAAGLANRPKTATAIRQPWSRCTTWYMGCHAESQHPRLQEHGDAPRGGEGGIRTHEGFLLADFRDRRTKPGCATSPSIYIICSSNDLYFGFANTGASFLTKKCGRVCFGCRRL